MNAQYDSAEEWFAALKSIARGHGNEWAIRDFSGWTDGWQRQMPEKAYYDEFPEHAPEPPHD